MAELYGEAKQHYVADLFARIAPRYDFMNTLITGGMHHRWKRETAAVTVKGLAGDALDIATGTGDLAMAMARHLNIRRAIGVDFLPEMVAVGNYKSGSTPRNGKVSLMVGDALSLPFKDNTFACATAGFSLRNMPDLPQALTEMVRVVQPGGRVTTLELTPMRSGVKASLFRIYFHRLVPLLGHIIAGDRAAYTYLPESVDYFPNADSLAQLYRYAGLAEVQYALLGYGTVALHHGIKPHG